MENFLLGSAAHVWARDHFAPTVDLLLGESPSASTRRSHEPVQCQAELPASSQRKRSVPLLAVRTRSEPRPNGHPNAGFYLYLLDPRPLAHTTGIGSSLDIGRELRQLAALRIE